MPHTATFKLDGKESDIKSFSYHFFRVTEENGRPAARVRKGEITVTLASDDKHKDAVVNWLGKPDQDKSGEVIIYEDDDKKKVLKTIKFEKGFIVNYREEFNEANNLNTRETFIISSEKITVAAANFDFKWPKA